MLNMDVCDLFHMMKIEYAVREAIDNTIQENKEYGVVVCNDGKIGTVKGSENHIDGDDMNKLYDSCHNDVDLDIHTHPHAKSYPSPTDFLADATYKPKYSCVYGEQDNDIHCYTTSEQLRKQATQLIAMLDEDKSLNYKYKNAVGTEKQHYRELLMKLDRKYNETMTLIKDSIYNAYNSPTNTAYNINVQNIPKTYLTEVYRPECKLNNILPELQTV